MEERLGGERAKLETVKPEMLKSNLGAVRDLLESIRSGNCSVEKLNDARSKGLITPEEHDSLMSKYALGLEKKNCIDTLTNVFNRANLQSELEGLSKELNYNGGERKYPIESVMVIYLDIKKFKILNDTYGHLAGDQALIAVARTLKEVIKRGDMVFRVGGDEFILLLPIKDKNPHLLESIFQRIKTQANKSLLTTTVDLEGKEIQIPVQLSMGYETLNKGEEHKTSNELLHAADLKMYQDKKKKLA